jgi:hypothetical protein
MLTRRPPLCRLELIDAPLETDLPAVGTTMLRTWALMNGPTRPEPLACSSNGLEPRFNERRAVS